MADVRAHGLMVNAWTANDLQSIREVIGKGVDGLMSNYPDIVNQELKAAGLR